MGKHNWLKNLDRFTYLWLDTSSVLSLTTRSVVAEFLYGTTLLWPVSSSHLKCGVTLAMVTVLLLSCHDILNNHVKTCLTCSNIIYGKPVLYQQWLVLLCWLSNGRCASTREIFVPDRLHTSHLTWCSPGEGLFLKYLSEHLGWVRSL